jgi:hypothetical protein
MIACCLGHSGTTCPYLAESNKLRPFSGIQLARNVELESGCCPLVQVGRGRGPVPD